ncbi:MAG: ABC transporter permease subunit [Reyranellaceae bacterium]
MARPPSRAYLSGEEARVVGVVEGLHLRLMQFALYRGLLALGRRLGVTGARFVIAVPYFWLLLFFLAPFLIVLAISFGTATYDVPPFSFAAFSDGTIRLAEAVKNYAFILGDDLYVSAYLNSLRIAAISTVLTLLIGYPLAYGIARASDRWRAPLLMLIILPFWTSFLIRIYAWIGILGQTGLLNQVLLGIGLIDQPLILLGTEWAIFFGIVYAYLPFMVLPLYATLEKMDLSLLEAAADLGARPFKSFLTVTLPLSAPGILAGCMLVFIPAVGEFVIPDLLGGSETLMIGKVLSDEFFQNIDWPLASAVAVTMLLILVLPIVWFQRLRARQAEREA